MKKVFPIAFFLLTSALNAQGVWTQKADFGGGYVAGAVGFSIDSNGYVVVVNDTLTNFWRWDQITNVWVQKANFPGGPRGGAVGFSVDSKGYVATGINGSILKNDLWEYNPATNAWIQRANFAGSPRYAAIAFSIGMKGYLGTGEDSLGKTNDFWEWDGDTSSITFNTWTQKANYGGGSISGAASFSIGTKGYIGMGIGPPYFWEWDQTTNTWTQKANSITGGLGYSVGFSIGSSGYFGTGVYMAIYSKGFVSWDQNTDTWSAKSGFIDPRHIATGFSIGSKGYIGMGVGGTPSNSQTYKDFWEFDPNGNSISEEELENSISVYPNPAKGNIKIKSSISKVQQIKIFDPTGKLVQEETINIDQETLNYDLSSQPGGIYFLHLKTDQGAITKKILIAH